MKRSRNDEIVSVVNHYLRRRQYMVIMNPFILIVLAALLLNTVSVIYSNALFMESRPDVRTNSRKEDPDVWPHTGPGVVDSGSGVVFRRTHEGTRSYTKLEHVLPGTTIITDAWQGCHNDTASDGLKPERRCVRNSREYIAACAVMNNGSTEATVSYSTASSDTGAWDSQFNKFQRFVHEGVEPYRSELHQLLFPLFVHIYLELLCDGHKVQAHKFGEHFRFMFTDVEDAQSMLATLPTLVSADDVNANTVTGEFRAHKYKVSLTESAFLYLSRFLKSEDNVILLQMISQHLDLTVIDTEANGLITDDTQVSDGEQSQLSPHVSEVKPTVDVTLGALQRIIQKINEGSPPLPSICHYTLQNTYQGLSSVCFSQDEKSMCAGFEDSRLVVWSLIPEPLPTAATLPSKKVCHISLAGDCEEDVQERLSVSQSLENSSPECATLRAHSGPIYSTCFLPDGSHILSASEDKTVRLWDVTSRSNIVCYRGHNYPVFCVDVSPVGSFFATCSFDETAKLWSTDRVFPIRTFIGHTRSVNCVRFHANGNYIATGSSDSTVRLWTLHDAQPVRLMHGHRGMVMTLAFSPNGKYLASAGEDRRVKIWDLSTGTLLRDLRGHTEFIYSLAFSYDSQILASGGMDSVIRLWDVNKPVDETSVTQSQDTSSSSSSLLGSFPTKSLSVLSLQFSKHSFLISAGT